MMAVAVAPSGSFAEALDDRLAKQWDHLQLTNSLGLEYVWSGELADVFMECSQPDWDGYGALPVVLDTFRQAKRFLGLLPLGTPAPSIGATPDGSISLEWHKARRQTLSVTIDADGVLHYAALLGPENARGSAVLAGVVPPRIRHLVAEVAT